MGVIGRTAPDHDESMAGTWARRWTLWKLGGAAIVVVAACGSDAESSPTESVSSVHIVATGDLRWGPDVVTATAGTVTIRLRCEGAMGHALGIDGDEIVACTPGEEATATIELPAGSHEFVCLVPGHDQMRGTIEVT